MCAYSLRRLDVERLFEPGYVDVDHIVPYSLSFDDRRSNKVLVLSSENRQRATVCRCNTCRANGAKTLSSGQTAACTTTASARTFCAKKLSDDEAEGFRQRNLQDTQHMARFLYNYISDHLAFAQSEALGKKRVFAVSGAVTSHLRKRWGLSKVRADGDLHHALDAAVVACTTDGMIRRISGYYGHIEGEYFQDADGAGSQHARTKERFPRAVAALPRRADRTAFRAARRTASGHQSGILLRIWHRAYPPGVRFPHAAPQGDRPKPQETVKGAAAADEGLFDGAQGPDRAETGQRRRNQRLLYALQRYAAVRSAQAQLRRFGGDGKKAFAEPFTSRKRTARPARWCAR